LHQEFLTNVRLSSPVTTLDTVSGATFLYFEEPILLTLPPQVITTEAFDVLRLVDERQPPWKQTLHGLLARWVSQKRGNHESLEMLAPLKDKCFKVIWLVYASDTSALSACEAMIASAGYSLREAANFVHPANAAGEVVRHIFLEAFTSLDQEISRLFDYCDQLFTNNSIEELLVKSYFLRLPMLQGHIRGSTRILLTNELLLQFLERLPVEGSLNPPSAEDILDTAAWELFRRIISPALDPIDERRMALIGKLLDSKKNEIERLKSKCVLMAGDIDTSLTRDVLSKQMEKVIRNKASKEIAELLELDRRANEQFLINLFGDEKTWIACATALGGLLSGEILLTTGAAVAALSSVGAKAFKSAAERRSKLKSNDFSLLYSISRST
jgi:hypothetical protein